MNRLYSFVLPAYKATYLKEAIDSILAQTYTGFELIVVNDASPEGLDQIVESYDDSRIRYYVNEENIGGKDLVAQWNHCMSYAKGEYLILASDDDVYHPTYLEKMDALVNRYPEVNAFRPRIQKVNHKGDVIGLEGYLDEYMTQLEYIYAQFSEWIGSGIPFWVFKKEKLQSIGGFAQYPLAWFSDDVTVIECADQGVVTTNEILFSFRYSGINITTRKNSKDDLIKKIDATEKYHRYLKAKIDGMDGENAPCMKSFIEGRFTRLLGDDKIYRQMFNTSLSVSLSVSRRIAGLKFISVRRLLYYWVRHIISAIVR